MASSPLEKIAVAFIILILSLLIYKFYRQISQSRGYKLPPGPWGWPLIGNLLDFPSVRPWTVLRDWSHTYGDMFCLRLMGSRMLVVSTADIALELMEKRSAIYSDKPVFPMAELTGWDFNLGIMPYGQRWRSIRAHFHQNFNSLAVPDYHGIQTVQIYAFLRRELEHAGKKHDPASIRLTLAAIILDIVYGLEVHSMEDEYLELIAKASEYFVEGLSLGKFWVNFIPILKYVPPWVPGAAAAKYGAESRPVVREMAEKPFRDIQSGVNQNPSVARKLFMRLVQEPDAGRRETQLQHVKDCTGLAYIVASETTFSAIQTFFCTMAMYPDIQQKAQKELEKVVGPERLPTYDDYEELPYVQAIFLECMRWLPVTPLGLSHRVIQDDYYNGYFIPKGTIIVPNIWQMLRDPNDYPDPERFNPDRFMKDGVLNREVRDPLTLAFGFGRRICPGRHLAQDNAFLTIASTLHVFNIMPSLDENGREMDPTPEVTTGVTSCADRFNYMLKPRSVAAEGLIRATQDV